MSEQLLISNDYAKTKTEKEENLSPYHMLKRAVELASVDDDDSFLDQNDLVKRDIRKRSREKQRIPTVEVKDDSLNNEMKQYEAKERDLMTSEDNQAKEPNQKSQIGDKLESPIHQKIESPNNKQIESPKHQQIESSKHKQNESPKHKQIEEDQIQREKEYKQKDFQDEQKQIDFQKQQKQIDFEQEQKQQEPANYQYEYHTPEKGVVFEYDEEETEEQMKLKRFREFLRQDNEEREMRRNQKKKRKEEQRRQRYEQKQKDLKLQEEEQRRIEEEQQIEDDRLIQQQVKQELEKRKQQEQMSNINERQFTGDVRQRKLEERIKRKEEERRRREGIARDEMFDEELRMRLSIQFEMRKALHKEDKRIKKKIKKV
ncbi:MAG: hypothetical protein EZS28_029980 [Streblomastix strix]|uniref:Uncharacterized protein n=1 Tax=Streblomastix strix TaxID=222440 RepID=A0A5J4UWN4_9EUKA|nr:MAG: hypothetical protein EZS28_029980 [Streblomastix strix]